MTELEIKKEKEYLLKVKELITDLIVDKNKSISKSTESIYEQKKFLWDNSSDYTDEELVRSMNEVDLNTKITSFDLIQLNKYKQSLNSPYFAKVVFEDKEYNEIMNIYIGICTIEKNHDYYVFDWRAPISSLFYNYEIGSSSYESPNGIIYGETLSKMQFKIIDGKLIRCFNSSLNIDDDFLQEILANSQSDKMKNIVSTIQREQNEVIRNISDPYLIVQGVAGSGKTSVALHRIAYLLYKNKSLNSNNILIFSPNDVFSDYISNVLPELGEENVLTTTFSDFAKVCLKPYKNIESYTEFLEKIYSSSNVDKKLIEKKMSYEYKNEIDEYLENIENNIKFDHDIEINNHIIEKDEIKELYSSKYLKFSYSERLDSIAEDICYKTHISLKHKNKVRNVIAKEYNICVNQFELYKDFLIKNNYSGSFISKGKVKYEDIMGLMLIYFKINGYPNFYGIQQVVIDEAQDYTYLQMEIFKNIFPNAKFTILGDVNQTINPFYKYKSLESLKDIFPKSKYIELKKAYRSSSEIIDYTNKILGISNIVAVRKENNYNVDIIEIDESNKIYQVNSILNLMNKNNIHKIAIITKNVEEAKILYKNLENDNIQFIQNTDDSIQKDVIIIPSYLSKGLEFEGVIVYNDKETYKEDDINLYYVVCSRAQHMLSIFNEPQKILKK